MTDRPADVGRGPLTAEGLCLYHSDLLPADCTLVGRTGCAGCLLSRRNLDRAEGMPFVDVDGGECRCPQCGTVLTIRPTQNGAFVAVEGDGGPHRHAAAYSIPIGQEAREARRAKHAKRRGMEIPIVD